MMPSLLLATHNTGKIAELRALLAPMICVPQQELNIPEIEETGLTFVENALLKARHASQWTQGPALADDSGLMVRALQGRPGIHSARYAGPTANASQRIEKLLTEMAPFPDDERDAYFYCALVYLRYPNDPAPIIATGECHGRITSKALGEQGFGYDPVFYIPARSATMAQIPASIKNTLSHRARALLSLKQQLGDEGILP